ncbi:hypothetical protein GWI33_004260 [Rhynchophorus ferrugineus]|uniref:Uncharacterized protein n=1 Tax=Rhynchophorus ferrugineus TaxID=354439 RepID=A0A834IIV8_RHYFE|nr:hypothetical protein GWI33_004260 [Rhynchophorus ferrugineus]
MSGNVHIFPLNVTPPSNSPPTDGRHQLFTPDVLQIVRRLRLKLPASSTHSLQTFFRGTLKSGIRLFRGGRAVTLRSIWTYHRPPGRRYSAYTNCPLVPDSFTTSNSMSRGLFQTGRVFHGVGVLSHDVNIEIISKLGTEKVHTAIFL